jgi:hypothetical protein
MQKLPRKQVQFAANLEDVYEFDIPDAAEDTEEGNLGTSMTSNIMKRTDEMIVLSSLHGKARRELREIDIFDLQSAVKHGVKTRGHNCPKTGMPRWIYTYGNIVYITDYTSTVEVTSYKQAIVIQSADITPSMLERHKKDRETIEQDPHMCATHSIVVIDQSGSMRNSDVKGFKTRSQAAYGVLALEYIAEQLHQREEQDTNILDAISVIEMNDTGTLIYHAEPMDWLFFNKLLQRQTQAKPRSHGNYYEALDLANSIIRRELKALDEIEKEDVPFYQIIFISDGKPSDKDPVACELQESILAGLASGLKSKLWFLCDRAW